MEIKDFLGDYELGIDIWEKKYRFNGESFDEWLQRVANGNQDIINLIVANKFIFAGRILANRGLDKHGIKVTLSNCYVSVPPEDSIESIYDIDKGLARTLSYGGGYGIDVSKISPNGARIRNAAKTTSGAVSFMEQFAHTTKRISQNGRRGALMLSIDCNHPDLEEFIGIKGDLDKIVSANISVRIDDEFMRKVEADAIHVMRFERKETGEVIEKSVNARSLFWRLAKMNWRTAEPGILFWDRINSWTLLSETKDFAFAGVNPCAEEPLPAGGSCLLSSINLAAYVIDEFTGNAQFDFDSFKRDIPIIVKEMNRVLDEGLPLHPLQEQRDSVTKWRQIGLGILGLADMFVKMGITYGSTTSIAISDRIAKVLAQEAIRASALLAKEEGAYPGFDAEAVIASAFFQNVKTKELESLVRQYGLRNSQLLTIAPTGSISTMLNVSGGIEPIFATHYIRTTESLHGHSHSYPVYAKVVKDCMEAYGVEDIPKHIVTAMNLDYKKRIKMQSTWQNYIDAAISSTINLANETSVEEVFAVYVEAWKMGLKGITVYRSGCEREGILTTTNDAEEVATMETNLCPECNSELVATNGCLECKTCGWGKCSL